MTTLHHTHSQCDQQRLGAPPPPRLQPRLRRRPPLRAARSVAALTGDAPPPKRRVVNGSQANHHHQQRGPPPGSHADPPNCVMGLDDQPTTGHHCPLPGTWVPFAAEAWVPFKNESRANPPDAHRHELAVFHNPFAARPLDENIFHDVPQLVARATQDGVDLDWTRPPPTWA